MKITFYGAAQNVTGSKHLIETGGYRLLLDCGMHQGRRSEANKLNRQLPFRGDLIDTVILSHGHLDHCGMIPALVNDGFKGRVYCASATAEVAASIMRDSAMIQEQDTAYFNRHHKLSEWIEPLYTMYDVDQATGRLESIPYFRNSKEWTTLTDSIRFKFLDAGHILGSAITVIEIKEGSNVKTIAFTGDLGQAGVPILFSPEPIKEQLDALLLESTYGDRNHKPLGVAVEELIGVVEQAIKDKSKIIVPAFSLGRTQELIYILHKLTDEKKIPRLPIYIDSPLAVTLTDIFSKYSHDFDHETWQDFGSRSEKPFAFRNLHYVRSVEESKSLNDMKGPLMIIAASGMAEGGRILHHLKNNISDPTVTVLVTGYQAQSTLGRRIQDGNSPVRIYGEEYTIRARVLTLNEFSAHADQAGLLQYLSGIKSPKNIFLVHGEVGPAQVFR